MGHKNSHCSYCGARFDGDPPWPRQCAQCGATSYVNPLPVAVLLLPVDEGLLTIRRAIPPAIGRLALPGGFVNLAETWQEAAAREIHEESAIRVDPQLILDFGARSGNDGTLLVFGVAPRISERDLPAFAPNGEVTERCIVREPVELAFPLHTDAIRRYFSKATPVGGASG